MHRLILAGIASCLLMSAAPPDGPRSSPAPTSLASPRIVTIKPAAQRIGYPISIELSGLPAVLKDTKTEVSIGGALTEVMGVNISDTGGALISSIVPKNLSDKETHPSVYVSIGGYLLVYEGSFTVEPAEVPGDPRLKMILWILGGLWVFGAVGAGISVYLRRRQSRSGSGSASFPDNQEPSSTAEALPSIDVPSPPAELIDAVRSGDCVAVIGSGMSAAAGLETYSSLLRRIIAEMPDDARATPLPATETVAQAPSGPQAPSRAAQLARLLAAGRLDEVIDSLNSLLPPGALSSRLAAAVRAQKPRTMEVYSRLAALPFSGVVSLNVDDLAVKAPRGREAQAFVPSQSERCLDALSRHEPFVFMMNGTADSPAEMLLSHQNVRDALARNGAFRDVLKRLYYSRPLLFLGVSLSGVQNFLSSIDRAAPPSQRHHALVEVAESTWESIAGTLESTFLVGVLPFTPDRREGAIARFLRQLDSGLQSAAAPAVSPSRTKIDRIELHNIGAFTQCALDVQRDWTVLLGDNGVGKSTVLRAMAVCLSGTASDSVAARLLKSQTTSGSIVIHMGDRPYQAVISSKTGGGAAIDWPSGVPLERERILALGFSALRTVGWRRQAKEETERRSLRPTAADLVALTSEEPDPRLDGIKQWIGRLDHLRSGKGVPEADRKRYAALFDRVIEMLKELTAGAGIESATVNPGTGEITIKTKDGPIPFESLSQGTLSLAGWVGALMQRLYETTPTGSDPMKSDAIVLVDEIDAHMHPAWQQALLKRLSEKFENVQFIVTSHSPLMVGGLEARQVYRFARDEKGVVQATQLDHSLKGLGAAGLLTSDLFGLASQLDIDTAKDLDRKRQLTAKQLDKKITPEERKDLATLEEKVRDIDASQWVRDPMYQRFVEAVAKVEAKSRPADAPPPIVLTPEEKEKKAEVAEEIVRELMDEEGRDGPDQAVPGKTP